MSAITFDSGINKVVVRKRCWDYQIDRAMYYVGNKLRFLI
jgi:hypothetical protein